MPHRLRLLVTSLVMALMGSLLVAAAAPATADTDAPAGYEQLAPLLAKPVVRSRVRLRAANADFIAGERVRMRVRVRPAMSRPVILQRRTTAGWTRVTVRRTNPAGRLVLRPKVGAQSAAYRAVLPRVVTPKRRYTVARSRADRVTVVPQSATLVLTPNAVKPGETVVATVDAVPARRGREVALQTLSGGEWTTVKTAEQGRLGRARFALSRDVERTYTFRAVVLRHRGARAVASNEAELRVQSEQLPPAPANVTADAGDERAQVSWDGVRGASEYIVRWTNGTDSGERRVGPDVTSVTLANLTNETEYAVRVAAVVGGQQSADSTPDFVTPRDTTAPPVPTGLTPDPTDEAVRLSWNPTDDAARYEVTVEAAALSRTVTATTNSVTVPNLDNGTEYSFQVRAIDEAGNASLFSDPITSTPEDDVPPAVPTGVNAVLNQQGDIVVTWRAVPGATDYLVRWSTGTGDNQDGDTLAPTTALTDTITGLAPGRYSISVASRDNAPVPNPSDFSEGVEVEVPTATP